MAAKDIVKGASAFLGLVVPQLGPVLTRVPEIIDIFRRAFTKVGGKDADYDALLAANHVDIERLKHPESFRETKPPT